MVVAVAKVCQAAADSSCSGEKVDYNHHNYHDEEEEEEEDHDDVDDDEDDDDAEIYKVMVAGAFEMERG